MTRKRYCNMIMDDQSNNTLMEFAASFSQIAGFDSLFMVAVLPEGGEDCISYIPAATKGEEIESFVDTVLTVARCLNELIVIDGGANLVEIVLIDKDTGEEISLKHSKPLLKLLKGGKK